jgi:hypothetical protein
MWARLTRRWGVTAIVVSLATAIVASPASAAPASGDSGVHVLGLFGWDPVRFMCQKMGEASLALMKAVFYMVEHAFEPDLTQSWFRGQYGAMLAVGEMAMVPLVAAATISAMLKGGLQQIIRTYVIGLPVAFFGGVVAIGFATLLQKIDQSLVAAVSANTGEYIQKYEEHVSTMVSLNSTVGEAGSAAGPLLLQLLVFMLAAIASLVLLAEMIFRSVLIYLSMLAIPIGFAAYVWTATRGWLTDIIETAAVMIMSKFIIACTLGLGFVMVTSSFGGDDAGAAVSFAGIGRLMSGMIVICMASVAAPAVLALVMSHNPGITRKEFGRMTPMNSDRQFTRSTMAKRGGQAAKGLAKAVK